MDDKDNATAPSPLPIVAPAPPACPRPPTSLSRRRAWTEPSVRLWWLMALAVLVMILCYAADRLWARHVENRLIATGLLVDARVISAGLHGTFGQTADVGDPVAIGIQWHGQATRLQGTLTRASFIGLTIPIHVDPTDPTVWTDQAAATPMVNALFVGLLLLPIVPVLAGVAALRRRGLLRTWQSGAAQPAVVSDRRQTPIAPLSYAVRCSWRDGDRRLFTVYVPRHGRSLARGDELWILVPPGRGRPVAAMWFDDAP